MRYLIKNKRLQFQRYKYHKRWKEFMFIYRRVRLTQEKIVIPVDITEIIEYPDYEMWAIYNSKSEIFGFHLNESSAAAYCLKLFKIWKKLHRKINS